jgi:hypothetical protein
MNVNKIKIFNRPSDKEITFPLDMNTDIYDRGDTITTEIDKIVEKVIGTPPDYELQRFSLGPDPNGDTELNYEFYFNDNLSYLERFTDGDVRFYSKRFAKSFFKLDLYDSPDSNSQKIYLTIILPTKNSYRVVNFCNSYAIGVGSSGQPGIINYTNCCGDTVGKPIFDGEEICVLPGTSGTWENSVSVLSDVTFGNDPFSNADYALISLNTDCECEFTSPQTIQSNLLIPRFILDHTGVKEGYFIYWYENEDLLNLSTMYMSAKFFDGSNGKYTQFITEPQSGLVSPFNPSNNKFYYQTSFNYTDNTYRFLNLTTFIEARTIRWYEFINPE